MNTLQDLNVLGNTAVSYANSAAYTIAFGANSGNTSNTVAEETVITVPKQLPLTSVSNAYQDILAVITANVAAAVDRVSYIGPYSNVWVQPNNAFTWTVRGIRDVNRYDEAFANLRVYPAVDSTTSFQYQVQITDQAGNGGSYTNTVTLTPQAEYSVPASIPFDEDLTANIAGISITDGASNIHATTYTITIASANVANGNIRYANITAGSHSITDTRANVNTVLSANAFVFVPAPDFGSNTTITYRQTRNWDGAVQANAVPITMVGNGHAEYSLTTSYSTDENEYYDVAFAVLDQDPKTPTLWSVTLQQITPDPATQPVNYSRDVTPDPEWTLQEQTLPGRAVLAANVITNLNSTQRPLRVWPYPDYAGTVEILYTQTKTYQGLTTTQANVITTSTVAGITNYVWNLPSTYDEDGLVTPTWSIGDPFVAGDAGHPSWTYGIYVEQVDPLPTGAAANIRWLINGNIVTSGNITGPLSQTIQVSGTSIRVENAQPSYLDSGNLFVPQFYAPPDHTGNVSLAFTYYKTQSTVSHWPGNVITANSVIETMTVANTHQEYSAAGSVSVLKGAVSSVGNVYSVLDEVAAATYTVTITQSQDVGNFLVSNVTVGNSVSIASNSRANVNAVLGNLAFEAQVVGNVSPDWLFTLTRTAPDNTVLANSVITAVTLTDPEIGDYWQGGYVVGQGSATQDGDPTHWLITAPRSAQVDRNFNDSGVLTTVGNFWTGPENTATLAANVTNNAAVYCSNYSNDGYTDWYLPSASDLQQAYVNLKPATFPNTLGVDPVVTDVEYVNNFGVPKRTTVYVNSGGSGTDPAQTTVALFQSGNAQAFNSYYLSSTTYDPAGVYINNPVIVGMVGFSGQERGGEFIMSAGNQANVAYAVRPFRRVEIE